MVEANDAVTGALQQILASIQILQEQYTELVSSVDAINGRVNVLAGVKQMQNGVNGSSTTRKPTKVEEAAVSLDANDALVAKSPGSPDLTGRRTSMSSSKIILTSYPGQSGVDPIPLHWGHADPAVRGPVVVTRSASTIRRRNGKLSGMP